MKKYQIIPIKPEHIESYCQAVGSVVREKKYLAFLEAPTLEMSQAFVQENLSKNLPHFIAVHEGKVIGWCDLRTSGLPIFSHIGYLGMGILAEWRGQGIGKALLTTTIKKAKEMGLTRIELQVHENNINAIRLYEKVGFINEGFHKNAAKVDSEYENLISMALFL